MTTKDEALNATMADSALERMAENERELGLDYMEPALEPTTKQKVDAAVEQYAKTGNGRVLEVALRNIIINETLDKMAKNARELGLDYKPAQKDYKAFYDGKKWCSVEVEQPAPATELREQQELDELTAQRDKLADILTRTANALKGEPPELVRHSWHDLPEVAQQLKARRAVPAVATAIAQGEPVVWSDEHLQFLNFLYGAGEFDGVWFDQKHPTEKGTFWWRKHLRRLFETTPQPAVPERKPLTIEQIIDLWNQSQGTRNGFGPFARSIEAAHGIGNKDDK